MKKKFKNSQKNQEIQQTVSNCVGNHAGEVTCQSATKEEQQAALDAGISFGKYRAFLDGKRRKRFPF